MTDLEPTGNVDPGELRKFDALAKRWWAPDGEFKALHAINPLRLDYVRSRHALADQTILDVGCGGGLLSEAMAAEGACVTGIDLAESTLEVARAHALESGLTIDYQAIAAEDLAATAPGRFDVVTCMELLEHVPDPGAVITAIARLVRPGGDVFLSTINRNPKSFLLAIVGAEYVLGMVPRGTHEYAKLIRPSELDRWCRDAGLVLRDVTGLHYNPLTDRYWLGGNVDVNYLVHLHREPG